MAIERLTEDISYISKLDNEPNDVGGFTPEELKAEFDKAANVIKTYLNETLIPILEGLGLEVAINYKSDNLKFMRIGAGGLLETSPDGVNWFSALTRGEPGPAGTSGVHVGTAAPTDESVNVWIDPAGTATTETWIFTLADGSEVSKAVYVK